jgi:arabinose-5-phosphate isomerase
MEKRPGETRSTGDAVMNLIAKRAREILDSQLRGISKLSALCDRPELERAVALLLGCRGRVVVSGVGKSGIVASKIAASMRSTGTPAVYLHPVDAMHGDLGLMGPADVGFFLSKSGESRELIELVPTFKQLGVPILSLVTRADSSLAHLSDLVLDVGPIEEAGPIQEVPTTSTTVFQVLGDMLTLLLLWEKGLTQEHFAFLHPGGTLGRIATLRVKDVMRTGDAVPRVRGSALLREALAEMIEKRLGMTSVVDESGCLIGILTDGDIRRLLHRFGAVENLKVLQVMTPGPKTIDREELLASAVHRMEANPGGPITALLVVDSDGKPDGVIHLHDCLRLEMRVGPNLA